VKVAAAQLRPVWLDPQATAAKVIATIADAAAQGVELLAFPEAFLSGYPFWISRTDGARFDDPRQKGAYAAYLDAAVELDGPELARIVEAVREHGVFTYLGITERGRTAGRGTVYCTLVAIDPAAGIVSAHRKLVPTYDERMVWGRGDGNGLRVHAVGELRVGGLNCWENWMPGARLALYAGGEDIHVGVWPGSSRLTADITRFIALEGRVWSLAASGLLSLADVPAGFPLRDELAALTEPLPFSGGSGVVSPSGEWVVGPIEDEERLVIAEVTGGAVRAERLNSDPTGHYSRPDVLALTVDRRRHEPVVFVDG
jgi:nitrilase